MPAFSNSAELAYEPACPTFGLWGVSDMAKLYQKSRYVGILKSLHQSLY